MTGYNAALCAQGCLSTPSFNRVAGGWSAIMTLPEKQMPILPSIRRGGLRLNNMVRRSYPSFIVSGFQCTTCPRSTLRFDSSAAPAARYPNTASSTGSFRVRTDSKKLRKWS